MQSEQKLTSPKAKQTKTGTLTGGRREPYPKQIYTHSKPTVPRASPKAHKSNFPKVSLLENRHDFALSFSRCGISNIAAMYNAQTNESDFTHPSPTRKLSQSSKVLLESHGESFILCTIKLYFGINQVWLSYLIENWMQ